MKDYSDKDLITMLTEETFKEADSVSSAGLSNEDYFDLRNSDKRTEDNKVLEFRKKPFEDHTAKDLNSLDMMVRLGFKNITGSLSSDRLFKININDFEVAIPSNWSVFEELCLDEISYVQINRDNASHRELFEVLSLMLGEESEKIFLVKNHEKISLLNFNNENSKIADNFENLLLMEITSDNSQLEKIA